MIVFPKPNQKKKFESFLISYLDCLNLVSKKINKKKIEIIAEEIVKLIKKKKNIFIAGNGGSASIANHFICDFNKSIMISTNEKFKPRFFSLTNSSEMITALANDISFDQVFAKQIKMLATKVKGDEQEQA